MPIKLNKYQLDDLCWGYDWQIEDENLLVKLVAQVLIGWERHVSKVLQGLEVKKMQGGKNAIEDAVKKLTVTAGDEPWHRDGLIFQIFSWIAANVAADNCVIIRSPHLIPAQKGFDGLELSINANSNSVTSVTIFEDKATTSPRATVRDKVWPEFSSFNAGERESELMQEVCTMLTTRPDLLLDVDSSIENLMWDQIRCFRISITVDKEHIEENAKKSLLKGYDNFVEGDVEKRRAELVNIPDLRLWMEQFCQCVIEYLFENEELVEDV